MKKMLAVVLGVLFAAPVFAEGWGVGMRLGVGENDPKTMKETYSTLRNAGMSGDRTEDAMFGGVEVFHEWSLENASDKLGLKLGFGLYGENEAYVDSTLGKVSGTEKTYDVPVTVYYRRDNGVKAWSFYGGAGVTFMRTQVDMSVAAVNEKEAKNKIFPHITAGVEYRFSELFALGLDARYNFAAKIKKGEDILSDRSGFGAAISGRFYF